MEKALTRRGPIRSSYRDGQVMVTPEDQDIFFINAERAAEACRDPRRQSRVLRTLGELCTNAGAVEEAKAFLDEALALAVASKESELEYKARELAGRTSRISDPGQWRGLVDAVRLFAKRIGGSLRAARASCDPGGRCCAMAIRGLSASGSCSAWRSSSTRTNGRSRSRSD